MKNRILILCLCLYLAPAYAFAQHEVHEMPEIRVEGHIPDKDPKGEPGTKSGGGDRDKSDKPGKSSVSDVARKTAKEIIKNNSIGKYTTAISRTNIEAQFNEERRRAATEGRNADAKFFTSELEKFKKSGEKANLQTPAPQRQPSAPERPKKDRADVQGSSH
jgi:hypothetical protein